MGVERSERVSASPPLQRVVLGTFVGRTDSGKRSAFPISFPAKQPSVRLIGERMVQAQDFGAAGVPFIRTEGRLVAVAVGVIIRSTFVRHLHRPTRAGLHRVEVVDLPALVANLLARREVAAARIRHADAGFELRLRAGLREGVEDCGAGCIACIQIWFCFFDAESENRERILVQQRGELLGRSHHEPPKWKPAYRCRMPGL